MLATGGSMVATIAMLKKAGCVNIRALVLVAAPEGIAAVEAAHPDVHVYTASIDSHLHERGYIIPCLGDAGDRLFGTWQKDRAEERRVWKECDGPCRSRWSPIP